jgi:hypothetical protein
MLLLKPAEVLYFMKALLNPASAGTYRIIAAIPAYLNKRHKKLF